MGLCPNQGAQQDTIPVFMFSFQFFSDLFPLIDSKIGLLDPRK